MMSLSVAYWCFEVSDIAAWERFGMLFGFAQQRDATGLFFRMDDRARRICFAEGTSDDLVAMGWEAGSDDDYAAALARVSAAGVAVREGSAVEAEFRGVDRFFRFLDPNGIGMEVALGARRAATPFQSELVPSGFVTGECGIGHIAAPTHDYRASRDFLAAVLGAKVSDYIFQPLPGDALAELVFLHTNPRHHSIAYAQGPLGATKHLHHFMVEVGAIEDVGRAYERVQRAGTPIGVTLGQHSNDKVVSFYAATPSGFLMEFGTGGALVDDATWPIDTYDSFSVWGHVFQQPA